MPPSEPLPLVFLLYPFRGLSFVQRQQVQATIHPLLTHLLEQGQAPLDISVWTDLPAAQVSDSPLLAAYVRALLLRCDSVMVAHVPGIPDDVLTEWVVGHAPKHGIVVRHWDTE